MNTRAEITIEKAQERYPSIKRSILLALYRHIDEGTPTGGFLNAVLKNNLSEAMARADNDNVHSIRDITMFLYNEAPSPCWGSTEKIKAWRDKFEAKP